MKLEEQQNIQQNLAIAHSATLAVDGIDLAAIFYMVGSAALKVLFEQITRYFMLPVAVLANIIFAGIAIRQAALNKFEGYYVLKAVTETVAAVAITTAVVCGLAISSFAVVAAPAIFAATFAMKTLVNLGSAIYFGVKAARSTDPAEKFDNRKKAIENGVGAVIGTVLTTAIVAVMLLAKPAMFIIGVIGGTMLATAALIKGLDLINQKAKKGAPPPPPAPASDELTNNAELAKLLGPRVDMQHEITDTVGSHVAAAPAVPVDSAPAPSSTPTPSRKL